MVGVPMVTVVMPTYKRLAYLSQALQSVLGQTWECLEVIVSDNSMSDEVRRLVESCKDRRVRYRHNNGNIGAMRNAFAAFNEATGDYVAQLGDDDIWAPTFLEKLVAPLEADPDLVVAFSDHFVIREDGAVDVAETMRTTERWGRTRLRPGAHRPIYRLALLDQALPAVVSAVFRRSAIDWSDFHPEIDPVYDLWLCYLAARGGGGAYYTPEQLAYYRTHAGSATSAAHYNRQVAACHDRFLEDERLREIWPELKRRRARFDTGYGLELLHEGKRREARQRLFRALRHGPGARTIVGVSLSLLPVDPTRFIDRARRLQEARVAGRRWPKGRWTRTGFRGSMRQ